MADPNHLRFPFLTSAASALVGALAGGALVARYVRSGEAGDLSFALPRPVRGTRGDDRDKRKRNAPPPVAFSVLDTIGNTPMIRVASLSDATGCDVLIKCEFANPGGSVKDRVALEIMREAMADGTLRRGGVVAEGTAGSTGVSVAMVANALGCEAFLSLPDDAAAEKQMLMRAFGAVVKPVRPVAITHEDHFVNVARRRVKAARASREENKGGLFCDQFENLANARAHFEGTGPEIWKQVCALAPMASRAGEDARSRSRRSFLGRFPWFPPTPFSTRARRPKRLDAFVCACGTGGTLAGVASFLRTADARIQCFLVDPQGSSLYNKVTRGVLYTHQEAEGKRLRNPFDTITEGVGINRLTRNFAVALGAEALFEKRRGTERRGSKDERDDKSSLIAGAFRCSDREVVEMSRFLARNDGLFLGSSSCVNIVGAVKTARKLGRGHRVVTIACDGGGRHLSKFWSAEYLEKHGLTPTASGLEFLEET